jgi:hypothetical protein
MAVDQEEVVRRFIKRYAEITGTPCAVTSWPDRLHRNGRAVDAVAEAEGDPLLAIEHTLVETFQGQKKDSARFAKLLGSLETELQKTLPYTLHIAIETFAFRAGQDWASIRSAIKAWVLANASALSFADTGAVHEIPGVPFRIVVWKRTDPGDFGVSRFAPPETDFPIARMCQVQHNFRFKQNSLRSL